MKRPLKCNHCQTYFIFVSKSGAGGGAERRLARANGDYICTLDSDDIWQPDFLEKCVAALEALDADFVFANWISEDAQNNRYHSYWEKFYTGGISRAPTTRDGA